MRREPRSCTGAFAGMAMGSAILKGVTYLLRRAKPENFKAPAQVGRAIHSILLERVTCGKPAKGHQQPPGLQILTWVLDAGGYPDVIWETLVPGPGLEPGYSAPKADVLPIRRSRNGRRNCSRGMQACTDRAAGKVKAAARVAKAQLLHKGLHCFCNQEE